ncbi:hypothetical protein ACWD8L_00585 [Streptomyces sp. NPDC005133]
MDNKPISNALALRATASAFDAQRGKPPMAGDPHRSPDIAAVARQISELGKLITDLGDEVLFRAADQDQAPRTARVISNFAEAIMPAGEAASALGSVAHQLASADASVHDAANPLHASSGTVSSPSVRLQAARNRSIAAAPAPGLPPLSVTTVAAPSTRLVRGR